jgi:hypothetical protein
MKRHCAWDRDRSPKPIKTIARLAHQETVAVLGQAHGHVPARRQGVALYTLQDEAGKERGQHALLFDLIRF